MTVGFIILRHVNSTQTNQYWITSYECIRRFYGNSAILIIDDNSNYDYVNREFEKTIVNTTIINSEYKGSGELLPYIYYLQHKHCECACIIHDSVWVNRTLELNTDTSKFLWDFEHCCDQPEDELKILRSLDNHEELLSMHKNRAKWTGCFGGMTVINHDFLKSLDNKYTFSNMIPHVTCRYNRCSFERVIAVIIQTHTPATTIFGNIHKYCLWGISYYNCKQSNHLPFIKVWSGR